MGRADGGLLQAPQQIFLPKLRSRSMFVPVPREIAEPSVGLLNRGVSVAGIGARECLPAKRSRPEMVPQRLEKIESAPENGMGPETSNLQDLVHGARLTGGAA
jgi:hypothetical protein